MSPRSDMVIWMVVRGVIATLLIGATACGRVGFDALSPSGTSGGADDAAARDASTLDAMNPEDASTDASPADASAADTSITDASGSDAAAPDASGPDSGSACPSPVAHWELDESGGATALDRISSENAVVQGAVTLNAAAGVVGGAAVFGGAGAINAAFIDNLPTNDFTWAAWIRPDDLGNRYLLSIRASDNSITYLKWTSESDAEFVLNDAPIIDGAAGFSADSTWQHVAVIRAGSAVTLYRNGTPIDTGTNGVPMDFASCVFRIGGGSNCAGTGNFQLWDGSIDDVRIYDRAIPQTEVMRLASLAPCP